MKNSFLYGSLRAIIKITKHRIALARAGRGLGVSWARIARHDNSKFHPIEFSQYVKKYELGIHDKEKWAKASSWDWANNHLVRNLHRLECHRSVEKCPSASSTLKIGIA